MVRNLKQLVCLLQHEAIFLMTPHCQDKHIQDVNMHHDIASPIRQHLTGERRVMSRHVRILFSFFFSIVRLDITIQYLLRLKFQYSKHLTLINNERQAAFIPLKNDVTWGAFFLQCKHRAHFILPPLHLSHLLELCC